MGDWVGCLGSGYGGVFAMVVRRGWDMEVGEGVSVWIAGEGVGTGLDLAVQIVIGAKMSITIFNRPGHGEAS